MRDLLALPKAHLHVHLESTVRPATLSEIAAGNGLVAPATAGAAPPVGTGLRATAFRDFAERNGLVRDCLRRPADFTRIAVEFCQDEAAQGTRYAEVTFTAAAHGERLHQPEMPLEAVLHGLAQGRRYGIECRVLLDHPRRRGLRRAWQTLRLAQRYAADGVVGIGVAGEETPSLAPFAAVWAAAHDAGVRLVHHAGEFRGPPSIREAITVGRADRLGHGVRVLADGDLVAEVRERGIALEVCPSSNVALGVAASFAAHPLPRLREAGLLVTINTDIPDVAGTCLTGEYRRVRDAFGYDDTVIAEFARASVDASFAPAATRARLHRGITAWLTAPSP